MDEENPLRIRRAARTLACSRWAPIMPLPASAVADGQNATTAILCDASTGSEAFVLADPEGIQARLAAA